MLILDLRWLLFGLLVAVIALGVLVARSRKRNTTFLPFEKGPSALERAPFGLLVLDGPSTYRWANLQARHLLDLPLPSGSLPKASWASLLAEDRETARREMAGLGRYRTVAPAPDRTLRWWVAPWDGLDIVFLLDVTAQQRAEQAAGYLLSDLSHELRTPLATILTHLEILLLPDISTEIGRQSLRLLKEEARRMARLVNDMLQLGRLETATEIERRPVDLLAVVEGAVAQITPQAEERGIDIVLEAEAPLPLVVGDADRLKQVFLNLLDNAVKFSRPGDRAVVSLQQGEEGIVCTVYDNGPGIPAEHLPHVTRRFYRGVPQGQGGSGLGLALVAEILRRHDSRLHIESRTDGDETGTRVRFVLPVLPEEVEG